MSRRKMPPLNALQGVMAVLDNRAGKSHASVIASARELITDVIAVLQEPDPLKKRIAFVLLGIQQSTEVKEYRRGGKIVRLAKIIDPDLYHWSMSEVHNIAGCSQ